MEDHTGLSCPPQVSLGLRRLQATVNNWDLGVPYCHWSCIIGVRCFGQQPCLLLIFSLLLSGQYEHHSITAMRRLKQDPEWLRLHLFFVISLLEPLTISLHVNIGNAFHNNLAIAQCFVHTASPRGT